ncbi:MAG: fluoride efflux transporter CrcB [Gemmatimonadetes bacterium HGW-Gemmatimonadetes-1]|nr:MAG: fluoride efflux transporter CrcB [Gemmatimonadetes bacterium HGW-Gemmatimonadetes-1]
MTAVAVALGGALGAVLRWGVGSWVVRSHIAAFPWATMGVSIIGSALLGGITVWATETGGVSQELRLFLTVGLCGGFTTFSSFAYEAADFAAQGFTGRAGLYAVLSVVLCVAAVFGGGAVAQSLVATRH